MPAPDAPRERIQFISIGKAVILLVALGHFGGAGFVPESFAAAKPILTRFTMPLFMALSGLLYFMAPQKQRYAAFLQRKFQALMVPYLAIYLAFFGAKLIVGQFIPLSKPATLHDIYNILLQPIAGFEGFLWFLYVLFMFFAIAPLFRAARHGFFAMGAVAFAIRFVPLPAWLSLDLAGGFFLWFWFGWALAKIHHRIPASPAMAVALFGTYAIALTWIPSSWPQSIVGLIACTPALVGSVGLSKWVANSDSPIRRASLFVGDHSFDIYIWHNTLIIPPLVMVFKRLFGLGDPLRFYACLALALVASALIAPVISRILARWVWTERLFLGRART